MQSSLCRLCEFLRGEIFNFCLLSPDGRGASLCYSLAEAPGPRRSDQSGRKKGMSHADGVCVCGGGVRVWLHLPCLLNLVVSMAFSRMFGVLCLGTCGPREHTRHPDLGVTQGKLTRQVRAESILFSSVR